MNPVRKFVKAVGRIFHSEGPRVLRLNRTIGIIQPTKFALENNTIDKFNKVITIIDGVEVIGDEIRWGKKLREYPYSEEKLKAIKQVHEIPIVERVFNTSMGFFQEPDFGSVENLT